MILTGMVYATKIFTCPLCGIANNIEAKNCSACKAKIFKIKRKRKNHRPNTAKSSGDTFYQNKPIISFIEGRFSGDTSHILSSIKY